MMSRFADRAAAGRQLAGALREYANRKDVTVLGLPRGGVPVAAEVASAIGAPLDVLVVRKIGAPGQPELAVGAIATGGVTFFNEELMGWFRNDKRFIDDEVAMERIELERRERTFRSGRPALDLHGRTAILVDDGAATGATMESAVEACSRLGAQRVVVALPVAARDAVDNLRRSADEVICLSTPPEFMAVGTWYVDFDQTSDAEVKRLLDAAQVRAVPSAPAKPA